MNLKKDYITNASAQGLGRICTMGANFIVFILAARLLGIELFGQYSYITVFLGLAILVAEFGTTSVLAADLAQVGKDASAYWGNFLILRLTLTLIVAIASVPVAWLVRPDLFPSLLVGLLGLFFLGSRFFDPLFQVFGHPWYSLWGSVVYSLVFAIFSIWALIWKRSMTELIGLYVLANVIYTLFAIWLSLSFLRPAFRLQWKIQKSILSIAVPVGISSILTLIHTRADTFMLAFMKGDYAVGIYNGAYRFLDMAVIAAVMLSNPMVPIFSKLALFDKDGLRRRYGRILVLLTSLIIPIALMVPLISSLFVDILFGPEYREVAPLLDIMAWIGVLTFYSLFNFVVLLAVKVVRFQVWLGGVTAVMNVVLNYFLIPNFSFYGSAWATLLVECIFVLVSFLYIIKSIGNIFVFSIWWRIGAACLMIFTVVYGSATLDLPWRLALAIAAWPGALMLFKIPLKQSLSG
ncbi:MAG: flippase [Proteobacteria bacterium]|nr:flippase [Pseudomonadota bacterium]